MTSAPVSAEMQDLIRLKLKQIAAEENIHILFAVESGSRAWGFHAPDSDYDVRFVYARPKEWHYALGKKRDVVERPIDDELDISGWELSKTLSLAMGSNAVVAEWLQSPIRYQEDTQAVEKLLAFTRDVLDRRSVTWHYLSLLRRQQSRLLGHDGKVRIKRYFYVLRPTLALRWMRRMDGPMPPMDMAALRAGCALPDDVAHALDRLTEQKMAVSERAETTVAEPLLDALIDAEVQAAQAWLEESEMEKSQRLWDRANALHMELSP